MGDKFTDRNWITQVTRLINPKSTLHDIQAKVYMIIMMSSCPAQLLSAKREVCVSGSHLA